MHPIWHFFGPPNSHRLSPAFERLAGPGCPALDVLLAPHALLDDHQGSIDRGVDKFHQLGVEPET